MDGFEAMLLFLGGSAIAIVTLAVLFLPRLGPDPDDSFYESGLGS